MEICQNQFGSSNDLHLYKRRDLRNLPNFSSITRLNFKYSENLNFDLNTQIVGKRFGLDSETILDNYQLVNLSFSYFFKINQQDYST